MNRLIESDPSGKTAPVTASTRVIGLTSAAPRNARTTRSPCLHGGGALAVSVPRRGSGATDRPTAKAVWIIDRPGDNGPTHLMHHRPGFACSCDDLETSGAVNKTFAAKLSASYGPPKYVAAQGVNDDGVVQPYIIFVIGK